MNKKYSRRNFLKAGTLSVFGIAFRPLVKMVDGVDSGMLFRVAGRRVTVFDQPSFHGEVVYRLAQDEILSAYYKVYTETGYNPLWYRVWGGYVNCAYLQRVQYRLNTPLAYVPGVGMPAEVSVPFSQSVYKNLRIASRLSAAV